MKLLILIIVIFNIISFSQEKREGEVTYITTQTVYVKFENTEGISLNDTLFVEKNNNLLPALTVKHISTRSVAGEVFQNVNLVLGEKLIAFVKSLNEKDTINIEEESVNETQSEIVKPVFIKQKKNFFGNLSIQSYSSFSNTAASDIQRWRYNFSSSAKDLIENKLNIESNISYSYRVNDPLINNDALSKNLRIYNLNVAYKFDENILLTFGRHFNNNSRNIGAIDGLSFSYNLNKFNFGGIAGSRPDFSNYGFNIKLFQYGAFISRIDSLFSGKMENSLVLMQQTNNFKTDRHFFYFQHSNYLFNNFYFFFSTEYDLYKKENSVAKNELSLTGLYFNSRFSPEKWISLSASYDARRNIIYYESFKTYADSIIENELRQGLKFSLTLKPLKKLFIFLQNGIRFLKSDDKRSTTFSGTVSYASVPIIESNVSFNFNNFINKYTKGNQFGFSLSKDFTQLNLYTSFTYRKSNISFQNFNSKLNQNIVSFDISSFLFEQIYSTISLESVFEEKNSFNRVFINFTKRF